MSDFTPKIYASQYSIQFVPVVDKAQRYPQCMYNDDVYRGFPALLLGSCDIYCLCAGVWLMCL